jgi:hypothetical protein
MESGSEWKFRVFAGYHAGSRDAAPGTTRHHRQAHRLAPRRQLILCPRNSKRISGKDLKLKIVDLVGVELVHALEAIVCQALPLFHC